MKEKREEIKQRIKNLKNDYNDPKYKAFAKLSLYMLFIFILIIMVRFCGNTNLKTNNEIVKSSLENLKNMNSYEYEIKIMEDQNQTTIKGIKYNEINDFEITNTKDKYTIIDNKIYKKLNEEYTQTILNINLVSLLPENISDYLIENNLKSELEYKNNEIKKEYLIYNFNLLSTPVSDRSIILTTYENSKYIYKIELDGTELLKAINPNLNNYTIEINYTNVNSIKNYKSN